MLLSLNNLKIVSSYGPINQDVGFDQMKADRMKVKAERAKEHMILLNNRYDLSKKTSSDVVMSGGKPIPVGPTVKLQGTSWLELDKLTPEQIKMKGIFPYKPLCPSLICKGVLKQAHVAGICNYSLWS